MSNLTHDPSLAPEPSDRKALFSAIGWLGVIFIFLFIVLIVYVPNRDEKPGAEFVEERLAIRAEVNATQESKISRYAWENQAEGVVRIPVERAMDLVVRELRNATAEPAREQEG